MKIPARGRLLAGWTPPPDGDRSGGPRTRGRARCTMQEAMRYVLSLPVSTVIVGCDTVAQVEENVRLARAFNPAERRPDGGARREGASRSTGRPSSSAAGGRTRGTGARLRGAFGLRLVRCAPMKPPALVALTLVAALPAAALAQSPVERPFGTLREQAAMQQEWLQKRLDTFLPGADAQARHRHVGRADARVQRGPGVPRRSPSPETFAARRRTIYVFFDKCAAAGTAPAAACVERIALGGTSQGGVFEARRSTKAAAGDVGRGRQAELWGDEQWQVLKAVIEERNPQRHRHRPLDACSPSPTACRAASWRA